MVNFTLPSPEKIIHFQWAGRQASDRHVQDLAFDTSQLGLGQVGQWSVDDSLKLKKNNHNANGRVGRPLTDTSNI